MTIATITWAPGTTLDFDWYDHNNEEERLDIDDVLEAFEAWLGTEHDEGTIAKMVERDHVETIAAFNNVSVPPEMVRNALQKNLKSLIDILHEDYGDPEDMVDSWTGDDEVALRSMMDGVVAEVLQRFKPWICRHVANIKVPVRAWWESLTDEERAAWEKCETAK